jgi:hypothetical protein
MHAEFVRFWPWEHLHDGEKLVEARAANPFLLIDKLATDHRDLRYWAAERQGAET